MNIIENVLSKIERELTDDLKQEVENKITNKLKGKVKKTIAVSDEVLTEREFKLFSELIQYRVREKMVDYMQITDNQYNKMFELTITYFEQDTRKSIAV